jgi:D-aspartate ligase
MTTKTHYSSPVVVVSAHTMALGVVRALGEAGVPVFVLHHDERDLAHASRYVRAEFVIPAPHTHESEFVEAVVRHADRFRGGMLLPASDEAVATVSRHKEILARYYVVACPEWAVTRNFIEKTRTYALAAKAGVATPATFEPASIDEAREAARRVGFPLLVKPSQSHLFYDLFKRKMVRVNDMAELVQHFGEARRAGVDVVVQEVVPGADSNVVNYNAYAWGGRFLVEFTARQIRKAPPRFGSPRVVVSERIEEVLEPGRSTLRALGFQGFACSEFKRDPRDGRFKILDVNGRPNLSGLLAVRSGINFPLLQYRHLMYGELPREVPFTDGVYWTDVLRDAAYSLRYLLEEHYSPWDYIAPYVRRRRCDAVFDRLDMRPFLARSKNLASSLFRRIR